MQLSPLYCLYTLTQWIMDWMDTIVYWDYIYLWWIQNIDYSKRFTGADWLDSLQNNQFICLTQFWLCALYSCLFFSNWTDSVCLNTRETLWRLSSVLSNRGHCEWFTISNNAFKLKKTKWILFVWFIIFHLFCLYFHVYPAWNNNFELLYEKELNLQQFSISLPQHSCIKDFFMFNQTFRHVFDIYSTKAKVLLKYIQSDLIKK